MDMDHQLIITACGRELIRRQCADDPRLSRILLRAGESTPDTEIVPELEKRLDTLRQMLLNATPGVISTLCPELLSLVQIYGGDLKNGHDRHILIHSQAWPDSISVALIADWLRSHGQSVETMGIDGLREGETTALHGAMARFTRWCGDVLTNYKIYEFHILFNPAGGSRILVGLLQTLAPFYAHESAYLLEPGRNLVRLPMPSVQAKGQRILQKHQHTFRRLAMGLEVHPEKLDKIPHEVLMQGLDDRSRLSFYGELLWDHNRRDLYGESMLEPISEHIILTEAFRDGAAELDRDRHILLNERLDQLSIYLEQGECMDRTAASALSFQPLKEPIEPSTHRCHGWADKALWQLWGHYEGSRFVLDRLGPAPK
ncbi:hypothetical protein Mmc1_3107 [Magnetococcus marinus MC-1]|uniref:CRISPR system ring nuclease SSO1393-like domain-containing protein n=1 Tax=Magnetococcus marinus (strain ATCC BAA-1437 / JCM 17883 / MC-1) TaxID=156889 RepID=A0LCA4_MAGMM|nr:hypothetical protein [Magnetococcus marinus]ABK45597.1 hypothetical protein Mmc1_3107 [Magnetococcus marinus MC-1]